MGRYRNTKYLNKDNRINKCDTSRNKTKGTSRFLLHYWVLCWDELHSGRGKQKQTNMFNTVSALVGKFDSIMIKKKCVVSLLRAE